MSKEDYVQEIFNLITDEDVLRTKSQLAISHSLMLDNIYQYINTIKEQYKDVVVKNDNSVNPYI